MDNPVVCGMFLFNSFKKLMQDVLFGEKYFEIVSLFSNNSLTKVASFSFLSLASPAL